MHTFCSGGSCHRSVVVFVMCAHTSVALLTLTPPTDRHPDSVCGADTGRRAGHVSPRLRQPGQEWHLGHTAGDHLGGRHWQGTPRQQTQDHLGFCVCSARCKGDAGGAPGLPCQTVWMLQWGLGAAGAQWHACRMATPVVCPRLVSQVLHRWLCADLTDLRSTQPSVYSPLPAAVGRCMCPSRVTPSSVA